MPDIDVPLQTRPPTGPGSTVVVGVDGSDGSITATLWAAGYAREIGARLRLIHAVDEPATAAITLPLSVSVTGAATRRRSARPGNRLVTSATAEARMFAPDIVVSGHLEPGGAVDALVHASTDAVLLVAGSRDVGRSTGSSAASIGIQAAAQARCPTVVVRGEGEPGGPVVVAVDDAEKSPSALRFAFPEAARRRAGLVAVHVWTPADATRRAGDHPATSGPDRAELHRSGRLLTQALATWGPDSPGVDAIELVLDGTVDVALPQGTAGACLAVVSTRGAGRFSGPPLSPTSQAILAGAECPVFVIREPETSG